MRIIGGQWRGRRLEVIDSQGLRPTPDRIRETLFNWLGQQLSGQRVLDCCAGAGALGFEAASRGAARVTLVEQSRTAVAGLRSAITQLAADATVELVAGDIRDYLQHADPGFDLVFVDPPYAFGGLRSDILQSLIQHQLMNPGCRLYLEWPKAERVELEHEELRWIKQKTAGQVTYAIAQWQ